MFCEQCGAELEQDARFCATCGKRLGEGDSSRVGSRLWNKKVITGIVGAFVLSSGLGGAVWWFARSGDFDSALGTSNVPAIQARQLTKQDTTAVGNDSLSRVQAKELLQQEATKRPLIETVKTGDVHIGFKEFGHNETECYKNRYYANLLADGFATVTPYIREKTPGGISPHIMCKIQFTEKATPYLLSTQQGHRAGETEAALKVADKVINEITGITRPSDMFGQTFVQVEFRYEYKPTPLWRLLVASARQGLGMQEGEETFVLYDDGWRVK